ncbi:MAG: hypothetical protein ACYCSN_16405 [Acidobacteriaceae bacterium]
MKARHFSRHDAPLLLAVLALASPMLGQSQADGAAAQTARGQFGGQPRVTGTVTAIAAGNATVKTQAGEIYQVVLTPNTRLMRERQPARISDIHVGDMLTAMGEAETGAKIIHAAVAMDIGAEQVAKMREGLGKVWIAGRVLAIEDTTLTIRRIDNVTQKIQVDETTSFRKRSGRGGAGGATGSLGAIILGAAGSADAQAAPPEDPAASGDSITLADVKVGDNVAARGSIKSGIFVPTVLAVSTPPAGGRRRPGSPAPSGASAAPQPSGTTSGTTKGPTQ